ncbi:MAG: AAA family ATPase [Gaiellaceae bacterium]
MAGIVGRDRELAAVDRFLGRPRPAALVIEGDAGIGKTILWREGVRRAEAQGSRVLVASPIESERQLPFAALADLVSEASADVLDQLPQPQRRALGVALLLDEPESTAPDRRAVAVAALGALRLLAAGVTLLLAIDDVQWLDTDSASVLEFLFRRLGEAPIALLFARRREREDEPLPLALDLTLVPVERLDVAGLSLGATGVLVREQLGASFRRPTLRRIHEASGGNPLFALGLARALLGASRAETDRELPLPRSLREVVQERLAPLPPSTVSALLVVAALTDPTRVTLEEALGTEWEDLLRPGLDAAVVDAHGERVRFTHPLLRSILYADASADARRDLHRRLARLGLPLEERARHLALSAEAPDEATAAVLEEAARAAALRGAPDAAAELATSALAFSNPADEEGVRRRRYLAAGEYWGAGDVDRARAELEAIVAEAPPGPIRAQALLRLAKYPRDILESRKLSEEAVREADSDRPLRFDALLFLAVLFYVTAPGDEAEETLAQAIELASAIGDKRRRAHGEVMRSFFDWSRGRAFDRAALDRAREIDAALPRRSSLEERALYLRAVVLAGIRENDLARESWAELERIALETGDETALADVLNSLGAVENRAGNWGKGAEYDDASVDLAEQTGLEHVLATCLGDRALRRAMSGRVEDARVDAERSLELVARTHEPLGIARARYALGFLALSLGDHTNAAKEIGEALSIVREMRTWGFGARFVPAAVEAAIGQGELAEADELASRLEDLASATDVAHLQAEAHRCRGLMLAAHNDLDAALHSLQEAVPWSERVGVPFEQGLTLLALGTVQRRARQKRAARETLQAALAIFESLGAPLLADRVRRELARIGGRAASPAELTPTEQQVAALVAQGKTNKEVAAELVVSVRAVEANLSRIYGKLGVRSRAELAGRYRADEPM